MVLHLLPPRRYTAMCYHPASNSQPTQPKTKAKGALKKVLTALTGNKDAAHPRLSLPRHLRKLSTLPSKIPHLRSRKATTSMDEMGHTSGAQTTVSARVDPAPTPSESDDTAVVTPDASRFTSLHVDNTEVPIQSTPSCETVYGSVLDVSTMELYKLYMDGEAANEADTTIVSYSVVYAIKSEVAFVGKEREATSIEEVPTSEKEDAKKPPLSVAASMAPMNASDTNVLGVTKHLRQIKSDFGHFVVHEGGKFDLRLMELRRTKSFLSKNIISMTNPPTEHQLADSFQNTEGIATVAADTDPLPLKTGGNGAPPAEHSDTQCILVSVDNVRPPITERLESIDSARLEELSSDMELNMSKRKGFFVVWRIRNTLNGHVNVAHSISLRSSASVAHPDVISKTRGAHECTTHGRSFLGVRYILPKQSLRGLSRGPCKAPDVVDEDVLVQVQPLSPGEQHATLRFGTLQGDNPLLPKPAFRRKLSALFANGARVLCEKVEKPFKTRVKAPALPASPVTSERRFTFRMRRVPQSRGPALEVNDNPYGHAEELERERQMVRLAAYVLAQLRREEM
ncbi:hypothetical protein OBBRIDRAFT_635524 [Obba rivulosa]|uniref:Uncharacterized protein n=1 Tax=Obba rivulosa TaxID=1052685 RepID=A0A8E2B0I4_9APHY|nr:hypothetical protein OBBRIDRAFT_635524 [Obba rivulosa]